jgi:hypothetical protein
METDTTTSPLAATSSTGTMPPKDFTVKNLQTDVQEVETMNVIFGGAIIILSLVMTGVVCYLGNIQIPFISGYYSAVPTMGSSMAGYPHATAKAMPSTSAAYAATSTPVTVSSTTTKTTPATSTSVTTTTITTKL